ncbi:MAG: hypothetical protein QF437_16415 [Planctomycetota bacterium]|nr:hypothetical protein [Planctomycetota bacterium]MDP7132083.1 hypothetical protein [Planctomycetota bacterium]MDP7254318.1 hypothetical protein [Planctomycetota bacterium]
MIANRGLLFRLYHSYSAADTTYPDPDLAADIQRREPEIRILLSFEFYRGVMGLAFANILQKW